MPMETPSAVVGVAKQQTDDEHLDDGTAVRPAVVVVVVVVRRRDDFEKDDACNNVCVMFGLVVGTF